MTGTYYNEIDPIAAEATRELMKMGLIPEGEVDERSIVDVAPEDLHGFTQAHFFSGIAVWAYALRCAGWSDDRPVWTGSCPCQPFSSAGGRAGTADERHLWPAFYGLITALRPPVIFGEQVASAAVVGKVGRKATDEPEPFAEWPWLDHVQADLEAAHYACGSRSFTASSIGAPHIRQRLYFVGMADADDIVNEPREQRLHPSNGCVDLEEHRSRNTENKWMADTSGAGREGTQRSGAAGQEGRSGGYAVERSSAVGMADSQWSGPTNGFWRDADRLFCRDGKWRPVESGTFPLVNGSPSELVHSDHLSEADVGNTKEARAARLKGYGNAIVAPQAEVFVRAVMETLG